MDRGTIEKINDFFTVNPIAKGIPSSREEIINAENELGIKFDKDYVFFGIDKDGKVLMLDYDFGGCNVLGESFEDYILKSLDD